MSLTLKDYSEIAYALGRRDAKDHRAEQTEEKQEEGEGMKWTRYWWFFVMACGWLAAMISYSQGDYARASMSLVAALWARMEIMEADNG